MVKFEAFEAEEKRKKKERKGDTRVKK
jgi:hypothetical protein